MQKYRKPYILAWALMIALIAVAVTGSWIKPHGITKASSIAMYPNPDSEKHELLNPPLAPNSEFLLGTDARGYDMVSLLLNGMKYTLGIALIITIIRFAIALPIGLWSGATGRGKPALSGLHWLSSSLPPLLFVYPPLLMLYYAFSIHLGLRATHPNQFMFNLIFVGALVLIGTFPLAYQFGERARFYNDKLYVVSSSMLGAKTGWRVRKHILPNIREEVSFAFLTDYVQVLFLMGQLAVLGIFIGGGERVEVDLGVFEPYTTTGEWFSMIANGIPTVRFKPWIVMSAGAFFLVSVMIVQFFLAQLKKGPYRIVKGAVPKVNL